MVRLLRNVDGANVADTTNVAFLLYIVTLLHPFFYTNIVFLAQAEYSYFSANVRLKIFLRIFLYYSV